MTDPTDPTTLAGGAAPRPLPRAGAIAALRPLLTAASLHGDWAIDLPGGERLAHQEGGHPGSLGSLSLSAPVTEIDRDGRPITRVRIVEPMGGELDRTLDRDGITWALFEGTVEAAGGEDPRYHFTDGLDHLAVTWLAEFSFAAPLFAERTAMLADVLADVCAHLDALHLDAVMDIDAYEWGTPEWHAER